MSACCDQVITVRSYRVGRTVRAGRIGWTPSHRRGKLRLVTARVQLAPLDEESLEPLLSVAAAEAQPEEVMPPVSAPAGWSHARREAFRVFHRPHFGGLGGPTRTQMYAVVVGGRSSA